MTENKYLFILCPPASGSTLLYQILKTSPQASAFDGEGQALIPSILFTKDRWKPEKVISWDTAREKWIENWNLDKPVLVEKSPPHLVRAKQLETYFPGSHFIIMMRNPYAFCEGIKRRWGRKYTFRNIAKFWLICAGYQMENIRTLKNSLWFTYEDLTADPRRICNRIVRAIPELVELNPENKFSVFEKSLKISNLNPHQISKLSADDLFEINLILKKRPSLMAFFNYRYVGLVEESIRFKNVKRFYGWARSLKRLPEPLRWNDWKKFPG
jgi:hypothetical protein